MLFTSADGTIVTVAHPRTLSMILRKRICCGYSVRLVSYHFLNRHVQLLFVKCQLLIVSVKFKMLCFNVVFISSTSIRIQFSFSYLSVSSAVLLNRILMRFHHYLDHIFQKQYYVRCTVS